MVAIMLEEMSAEPGMSVLEVGAGSGYNAALMAELVAPTGVAGVKGHVTTVERLGELVEFASENLRRTGYSDRVSVHLGDGTLGYPERSCEELYDRIVVTAAAPSIPQYLKIQLKKGGVLLIPVGDLFVQSLVRLVKDKSGKMAIRHVCECMFVPLIGEGVYS